MKTKYALIFAFMLSGAGTFAQELTLPQGFPPFTIDVMDDPAPGYFFLNPQVMSGNKPGYQLIMDNFGTPIYYEKTKFKTYCLQPFPNGYLAYFEGSVLKYVMLDSSYVAIDTMGCVNCDRFDLHEIRVTADGHYFLAGKVFRVVDMSAIVAGGDPNATIEDYVIQEFDPDGHLVFEWNTRDHYAITDVDPMVDLTTSSIDPTNFNAIEVESDTSLLLSMAHQDEITKIDRRTGEVIWRLGGKNNEFTFVNSTRPFTRQHDVRRLPNGNITIFDNGTFSDPQYSRGVEYELDEVNMTATQVWEFDHGKTIQSSHKGNVQRLPNGNTLISWGGLGENPAVPSFTEVKPDGTIAYQVSYPEHDGSYRVLKFPWKTNIFKTPVSSINFGNWDGYTESIYLLQVSNQADTAMDLTSYAVHSDHFFVDETFPVEIPAHGSKNLKVIFYPSTAQEGSTLTDVLTLNCDRDSTWRVAIQVDLHGVYPDMTPPVASFTPVADSLPNDSLFRVLFSEPVRKIDDSPISDSDLPDLITLKKGDENGMDVPFSASINEDKTIVTVIPDSKLENEAHYYLAMESLVEDAWNNKLAKTSKIYRAYSPLGQGSQEIRGLLVFPNPVRDRLIIQADQQEPLSISVFNSLGNRIQAQVSRNTGSEISLDFSGQASGLYILRIHNRLTGKDQYVKIFKQ